MASLLRSCSGPARTCWLQHQSGRVSLAAAYSGHRLQRRAAALPTQAVLEQAREVARQLGAEPAEVYDPWFSIDAWQQTLLFMNGVLGDGTLAVMASVLLLRAATWPWNWRALQRQYDRMELLPIFMDLTRKQELARRQRGGRGGAEVLPAQLRPRQLNDFVQSTHFSPLQGMGYQWLCIVPLSVHTDFALRGMLAHPDAFHDFVVARSLWLDSLVLADPFGVWPVLSALAVLANMELNSPRPQDGQEENALYMKLVMRGATLTFVPITALLPSAMIVFMGSNDAYIAAITWIFRRYFWIKPSIEPRWLVPAKSWEGTRASPRGAII